MLPTVDSKLFRFRDGNEQLARSLLKESGARFHPSTKVSHINCTAHQTFMLTTQPTGKVRALKAWKVLACKAQSVHHDLDHSVTCCVLCKAKLFIRSRTSLQMLLQVEGPYNAVVLATPLELAKVTFSGADMPDLPSRQYQSTVTTYVEGQLKPEVFGADMSGGNRSFDVRTEHECCSKEPQLGGPVDRYYISALSASCTPKVLCDAVDNIAVADGANTSFSSIGVAQVGNPSSIYKLFSTSTMSDEDLEKLFGNWTRLAECPWLAYPVFSPPEKFAPFVLVDGLLYNNAWENAASALEMSAISARNSAQLIYEQYLRVMTERASTCDLSNEDHGQA